VARRAAEEGQLSAGGLSRTRLDRMHDVMAQKAVTELGIVGFGPPN